MLLAAILPGGPELVLILIIIFITFGLGKLSSIGDVITSMRKNFKEGQLEGEKAEPAIDITPDASSKGADGVRKPGAPPDTIDEAELDEET